MFNSFRAQLTLVLGGLTLILCTALTIYISHVATDQLVDASRERISSITRAIAQTLSTSISERKRTIVVLSKASALHNEHFESDQAQQLIDTLQDYQPDYAWIGIADTTGIVRQASDNLLQGKNVAQRPWFTEGLKGPYLGDVHEAVLLANLLPNDNPGEPLRFVDFVVPLINAQGKTIGVLGAHAHWSWVTGLVDETLDTDTLKDGIQVFIVNNNNEVLYPYAEVGKVVAPPASTEESATITWSDGRTYLTSESAIQTQTQAETGLGWRVVVRQPVSQALVPVAKLQKHLALFGMATVLVAALAAYLLARRISRPIETLHRAARSVQAGQDQTIPAGTNTGPLEVRELYSAFYDMTTDLLRRKSQLEQINVSLEKTVDLRTAELRDANRHLEQLARRDPLTGLNNRLSATEHLEEEFARFRRNGLPYAVLMIDIDHFKRVNDNYGHDTGDLALKTCADLLCASLRESDFVARFGGEEFIALLPATDKAGAQDVAQKLCEHIAAAQIPLVGKITVSVGLACSHARQLNQHGLEIVREADQALYRAKANGRNRVEVFTEAPARIPS